MKRCMHCVPSLHMYIQEMCLLSAAYDGDIKSLDYALGAGVPVDCQIIVSLVCKCESF